MQKIQINPYTIFVVIGICILVASALLRIISIKKHSAHLLNQQYYIVRAPKSLDQDKQIFTIRKNLLETQEFQVITWRSKKLWLGQKIEMTGKSSKSGYVYFPKIKIIETKPDIFFKYINIIRQSSIKIFSETLHAPYGGIVAGMLIGDKSEVPKEIEQEMKRAGTLHTLTVSGYNVSVVIALLLNLAGILPRRIVFVVTACSIVFFMLLTGLEAPVLRAGCMGLLVLTAQAFGRQTFSLYIFFIAALLLMIVTPSLFYSLSFQLSSLATLGILLLLPSFKNIESHFLINKIKEGSLIRVLLNELYIALAAQAAVTPLLALRFGEISLISPLTNMLTSWVIPFIMLFGSIVLVVGYVSIPIGSVVAFLAYPFTAYFLQVNRIFSHVPYTYFQNIKIIPYFLIAYVTFLLYIILKYYENKKYSDEEVLQLR